VLTLHSLCFVVWKKRNEVSLNQLQPPTLTASDVQLGQEIASSKPVQLGSAIKSNATTQSVQLDETSKFTESVQLGKEIASTKPVQLGSAMKSNATTQSVQLGEEEKLYASIKSVQLGEDEKLYASVKSVQLGEEEKLYASVKSVQLDELDASTKYVQLGEPDSYAKGIHTNSRVHPSKSELFPKNSDTDSASSSIITPITNKPTRQESRNEFSSATQAVSVNNSELRIEPQATTIPSTSVYLHDIPIVARDEDIEKEQLGVQSTMQPVQQTANNTTLSIAYKVSSTTDIPVAEEAANSTTTTTQQSQAPVVTEPSISSSTIYQFQQDIPVPHAITTPVPTKKVNRESDLPLRNRPTFSKGIVRTYNYSSHHAQRNNYAHSRNPSELPRVTYTSCLDKTGMRIKVENSTAKPTVDPSHQRIWEKKSFMMKINSSRVCLNKVYNNSRLYAPYNETML